MFTQRDSLVMMGLQGAKEDNEMASLTYYVRFLKDTDRWDSKLVAWGQKVMGDWSGLNHVVLEVHNRLIELTWEGLDIADITPAIREELEDRTAYTVALEVPQEVHRRYLASLYTLIRCNCRARALDFFRILVKAPPLHPVCTYPVLELLGLKHNACVLPKNLLGAFYYYAEVGEPLWGLFGSNIHLTAITTHNAYDAEAILSIESRICGAPRLPGLREP